MSKLKIVLIVDDDEDDRSLFYDAVKEVDSTIACISANDGEEALELLKNKKTVLPDFIFLDLNMPRVNGKQCLIEIKKMPGLNNIPVVIYSTTKRAEDVEEMKKLGASQFLTKPALFSEICHVISDVFAMYNV
ncbi:MAG: response regulator receiver protein [Bacteroidetes bacterium]|nr:response regulator receiver protein [Bacteroidota bacterium]